MFRKQTLPFQNTNYCIDGHNFAFLADKVFYFKMDYYCNFKWVTVGKAFFDRNLRTKQIYKSEGNLPDEISE